MAEATKPQHLVKSGTSLWPQRTYPPNIVDKDTFSAISTIFQSLSAQKGHIMGLSRGRGAAQKIGYDKGIMAG